MNKKLLSMAFVSLLAAATFSACSNDNDDDEGGATGAITELTIDVENAEDIDADTVKVVGYSDGKSVVFASVPYPKGKFTLQLPATVDDKYLDETAGSVGVTVSDANVKVMWEVGVRAYKLGKRVGHFSHRTGTQENTQEQEGDWDSFLTYANGDVTLNGTSTVEGYVSSYNLHLKKGWNMVYIKMTKESASVATTTAPSGVKWYYEK